jgi:hypothetical protein
MAIWQFRVYLIPTSSLRAKFGTLPESIPEELEDFPWWSQVQPPPGFEAGIDEILPKATSWSEDLLIWGDDQGDTAQIWYDRNRKVNEIGFRADVRRLSHQYISHICRLAKEWECMLLTTTYHLPELFHLIPPDDEAVLAALKWSTAKKFLDDPTGTLLSLKQYQHRFSQHSDDIEGDRHRSPKDPFGESV